ncbi:hypothetical protein MPLDJ20_60008 [Mesorhizobium plurifarium]|uniref:Uncharacterized protein n=1 Tax=Mesorhizobium plurifarium TaxID=69974 RepID=A0A090FFT0_MESPL|nr:hypothetical protein MPLDJ20_60008 [Mesorhizobium plurifarium]
MNLVAARAHDLPTVPESDVDNDKEQERTILGNGIAKRRAQPRFQSDAWAIIDAFHSSDHYHHALPTS